MFLIVAWCAAAQAAPESVTGRYVNVSIPGNGKTLSLAEVQVFSDGANIAKGKKTTQTNVDHGGSAARGVDGNTSGDWGHGSITHTAEGTKDPAWEVDLGKNLPIEKIVIWNRNGFESRLYGCRVTILDGKRKAVWGADIARPGSGATELLMKDQTGAKWLGKKIAKIAKRPPNRFGSPATHMPSNTRESLRLAINDLIETFGPQYAKGEEFLARLDAIESKDGEPSEELEALRREALLANPLLDFDQLLLVRRKGNQGLPANWQGNTSIGKTGYDNEIVVLDGLDDGEMKTLFKPDGQKYVGEVDLDFGGDKMLFTSIADNNTWAIFEMNVDGSGLRQVSPDMGHDVDNYDPIYLPSGKIIFDSSSTYTGVPCVGGNDFVANLHIMNPDGGRSSALLRAGQRLVSGHDEQWPRNVSALGVHRLGPLFQPRPDAHEPGRHGPEGLLRQQFVLAQLALLCPTGSQLEHQVRRHC